MTRKPSGTEQGALDDTGSYWIDAAHAKHQRNHQHRVAKHRQRPFAKILLATALATPLVYVAFSLFPRTVLEPPRTAPGSAEERPTLIVLGDRLGPVRIGMAEPEVVQILGRPSQLEDTSPPIWNLHWTEDLIWVTFFDKRRRTGANGMVWAITTQSPKFRTKEGIGVGSSLEEVLRTLGEPPDIDQFGGGGYLAWWGLRLDYVGSSIVSVRVSEIPSKR